MSVDERTPHLDLPLPHKENRLEEDVYRIEGSIIGLDQFAGGAAASMGRLDELPGLSANLHNEQLQFSLAKTELGRRINDFEKFVTDGFDASIIKRGEISPDRLPFPLDPQDGGTGATSQQAAKNMLQPPRILANNIVYITESLIWYPPEDRLYYVIIQGGGGGAGGIGGSPGGGGGAGGQGLVLIEGKRSLPWVCTIGAGGQNGEDSETKGGGGLHGGTTILRISEQRAWFAGGGGGGGGGGSGSAGGATQGAPGAGGGGFGSVQDQYYEKAYQCFTQSDLSNGQGGTYSEKHAGGNGIGWGAGLGGEPKDKSSKTAGRAGIGCSGGAPGKGRNAPNGGATYICLPQRYGFGGSCPTGQNLSTYFSTPGEPGCIVIMW